MTNFIYPLFIAVLTCVISSTAQNDSVEIEYRSLSFDFEVLLNNYQKEWQHLTETSTTLDLGDFFGKEKFFKEFKRSCEILGSCRNTTISCGRNHTDTVEGKERKQSDRNMGKETETEPWKRRPKREDSNVPVFYMPGGPKKTRDCAMVNGLLGGFNTFNYLTFVTGLITLVLNVNNNLNNNNNNNNLNTNNDISNNNVNANTNTQNANQVVIFPPGRKRRSLTDWLLVLLAPSSNSPVPEPQSLPHTTTKKHQGTKSETRLASSAGTELTTTLFTLLYAWIQGGLDDSVEGGDVRCSWVKYCRVLDHLDIHYPLLAPYIRSFSQKVSPKWLSSLTCHYLYAICPS